MGPACQAAFYTRWLAGRSILMSARIGVIVSIWFDIRACRISRIGGLLTCSSVKAYGGIDVAQ